MVVNNIDNLYFLLLYNGMRIISEKNMVLVVMI